MRGTPRRGECSFSPSPQPSPVKGEGAGTRHPPRSPFLRKGEVSFPPPSLAKGVGAKRRGDVCPAFKVPALVALFIAAIFSAAMASAAEAPSGPGTLPPKLEIRYQRLANELRCPVCQNETIAVSDAVISADLRRIVREKLLAGESDKQIRDYMISRYGLFAVYKPPVARNTLVLWFGPLALLLIAAIVAMLALRRRRRLLSPSPQPSPPREEGDNVEQD